MHAQYIDIADHALLVIFADNISDMAHEAVVALDKAILAEMPIGVIETVPALVNLLISFDPIVTDHITLKTHISACIADLNAKPVTGMQHRVQICYDPPFAPDLPAVAAATGLQEDSVINAHLTGNFHVLMYGFSPGYAYLSGVPDNIHIPRKPTPLRDVPAGSVIIAGAQCLITTLTMPTGWSIIGRSPTRILTNDPNHPFLFDVGDSVEFERIDAATYHRLNQVTDHG